MKREIEFLIVIFSLILFLSCENTNHKSTADANTKANKHDSTLAGKIEKLNKSIEKSILAGDYESLLPYYTDDIIISFALSPPVKGKEAIKEIYKRNKKKGIKHHSFSSTPEDIWECSDKIYERGKFGTSLSSNDHPKPIAYYGSYFTIWQKDKDNSLKIKYLIWNLDFNPYGDKN